MSFPFHRAIAFLAVVLASGCQHRPPAVSAPPAEVPSWFRVAIANGRDERLLTNVQINGKPAQLGLDTGAAVPFLLFSGVIPRLQLNVERPVPADPNPVPGQAQVGLSAPSTVQAFGQRLDAVQFFLIDIPPDIPSTGDADGLVGWPAIRENTWAFSLSDAQRPLMPLDGFVPPQQAGWIKLLVLDEDQLELKFAGDAPAPRLLVDTGNDSGVMLPPARWREWLAAHPGARKTVHASFLPGQNLTPGEIAWADEIRVGDLILRDVPVEEAQAAYVVEAKGADFVALGLAALKRIDLVLDGATKTAFVRPGAAPPAPFLHNRTGVQFLPRAAHSDDLVARVLPGGPADRAGVRDGDVLVQVNGWAVAGWRQHVAILWEKTVMTAPAGTHWSFVVRRAGQIVRLEVVAENLIGPAPAGGP